MRSMRLLLPLGNGGGKGRAGRWWRQDLGVVTAVAVCRCRPSACGTDALRSGLCIEWRLRVGNGPGDVGGAFDSLALSAVAGAPGQVQDKHVVPAW